jgi:hypothetical protein
MFSNDAAILNAAILPRISMTDDLIDRIYESSFVPEPWPSILDALSNFGAQSSEYGAFEFLALF